MIITERFANLNLISFLTKIIELPLQSVASDFETNMTKISFASLPYLVSLVGLVGKNGLAAVSFTSFS